MTRAVLAAAVMLAGCGSSTSDRPARPGAADIPAACRASAAPVGDQAVPDSLPKPAAPLIAAAADGATDQTVVRGFVAATPSEVVADLMKRDGVEVVDHEDDVNDAELTLRAGGRVSVWKLRKACPQGSAITVAVQAG